MNTIYVRGLRRVTHTVFCVDEGQKTYYDPLVRRSVPYSSGQQVKRSIIENMLDGMNRQRARMTFRLNEDKKGRITAGEVYSDCDPTFPDLLVGGWMRALSDEDDVIKRRSPLSISALTPLHPALAASNKEVVTLDRREDPEEAHRVLVYDNDGNAVDDIDAFFDGKDRTARRLQFTDKNKNVRASGLFEYSAAIDLTRLFSVPKRMIDPELTKDAREQIEEAGWPEDEDYYYAPKEIRDKIAETLAEGLVMWRVTSNQQRTFDLQQNLVTLISDDASLVANALYATYTDEVEVEPVVEQAEGLALYVASAASSVLRDIPASTSVAASRQAALDLKERILAYSNTLPA